MKKKLSIKILLITIIPILLISTALSFLSLMELNTNVMQNTKDKLKASAIALYTGNAGITMEHVDSFKSETGITITKFMGDTREITTIDSAVGSKADVDIYNGCMTYGEYFSSNSNVNGEAYFAYYMKTNDGMLSAAYPKSHINDLLIENTIKTIFITIVGIIIVIIFVLRFVIGLKKDTEITNKIVDKISNKNLLQEDIEIKREDEIGKIVKNVISLSKTLRGVMESISETSTKLNTMSISLSTACDVSETTSEEICKTVEEVANGAVNQAELLQQANVAIDNIGQSIEKLINQTSILSKISEEVKHKNVNSKETLNKLVIKNQESNDKINKMSDSIHETNDSIMKINGIVETISEIANNTKLLAINAMIESAHAGEHGKGFSVVAKEVEKLAVMASNSSDNIKSMIDDLDSKYSAMSSNMDDVLHNTETQREALKLTEDSFNELDANVNMTYNSVELINNICSDINTQRENVVDMIANLSAISEENAAATEEVNAGIEELHATINNISLDAGNLKNQSDEVYNKIKEFQF